MDNISYSDFENICRICMLSCDIKFAWDKVISDVFYKLTDIHLGTNDDLPQHICLKCFDKVNEIREFAFQCKRTHACLLKCINNFKNAQIYTEQKTEEINESFNTEEDITFDEHKIEFLKDEALSSASENNIDELKSKQDKNNESGENIIPETNNQNINCSEDVLNRNTPNIEVKNEQESNNNLNQNDSIEYTPDFSISSYIDTAENNNLKCEICQKTFLYSYKLKIHMRMHSGERPYKCELCPRMFSQSGHLKDHIGTHTGERPFKCEQCPKSFSKISNLKDHKRTHSGERPFKCELCTKFFARSDTLKKHMHQHQGVYPYKCEICPKMFIQSNHLKEHMRTHTGERPYECELCTKSFSQSSTLKKHLRTHSF